MNRIKALIIFTLCLFTLLTCGLEEHYYLPQVPESGIQRELNTRAKIFIPKTLLNDVEHYATGYVIFYKIYISSTDDDTITAIVNNNSRISSDYRTLFPFTDPTNTSSIPTINTFNSLGFYELETYGYDIRDVILYMKGRTDDEIIINFEPRAGIEPNITFKGIKYILYRSNGGGVFNPKPDRFFFASSDINSYAYAIPTVNADVTGQTGTSDFYAYVSMYIVTVGQNPNNFSRLYSKPTLISIFKLPDIN